MLILSPIQVEHQERDRHILGVARELVLANGYFGVTMDQIARESGCPKGTLYHRFSCKEDVLVAMAVASSDRRSAMMGRAVRYEGRTRERLLGIGEAAALFGRLYPQDLQILRTATGPIREKASVAKLMALVESERAVIRILSDLLDDAIAVGDLKPDDEGTLHEMVLGNFGLMEGGFTLIQDGVASQALGVGDPYYKLWRYFNHAMDSYGWRPFFDEWDYEESLCRIRRDVFPDEAQQLYGGGMWYGDRK